MTPARCFTCDKCSSDRHELLARCSGCDNVAPLCMLSMDPSEGLLSLEYASTDEDRNLVLHRLGEIEAQLANVDRLRDLLAVTSNKLSSIADLQRYRIAPVRRLPVEILRKIFLLAPASDLVSGDMPALVLSQVCSTWRAISRSTSQLWAALRFSGISIESLCVPVGVLSRRVELYYTLATEASLLQVQFDEIEGQTALWTTNYTDCNAILLRNTAQWEELIVGPLTLYVFSNAVASPVVPRLNFSSLTRFKLSNAIPKFRAPSGTDLVLLSKAPNLLSVDVGNVLYWTPENLVGLSTRQLRHFSGRVSMAIFFELALPQLEVLELWISEPAFGSDPQTASLTDQSLVLPSLHTLRLDFQDEFDRFCHNILRISCPALSSLHLASWNISSDFIPPLIQTSRIGLTSLSLSLSDVDDCPCIMSPSTLESIFVETPSLQHLTLKFVESREGNDGHLSIDNLLETQPDGDTLNSTLLQKLKEYTYLPRLKTFEMSSAFWIEWKDNGFFDFLSSRTSPMDPPVVASPHEPRVVLERISLSLPPGGEWRTKDYPAWLLESIQNLKNRAADVSLYRVPAGPQGTQAWSPIQEL